MKTTMTIYDDNYDHDDDNNNDADNANNDSMYLTSLAKSKSLLLTRDTADDGDSSDTKITAELDCFFLNLLCKLSRRRKNYGVRTQLRIFKPSSPQQSFPNFYEFNFN